VAIFLFAGYFFGNLPAVQENFTLVILAIIIISVLPAVFEVVRDRVRSAKKAPIQESQAADPES
jgi:membrane-associated protein